MEGKIMNRKMWNEKMELAPAMAPAGTMHAVGSDAVGHFVKQVAQAVRRSLTRIAIERELSRLDDRSLADIGVIRATIGAVASKAAGEPDLGAAFVAMLQNAILVPYKVWRERTRAEADLSRLSDRELLDIGLSRADIPAVVAAITAEHVQPQGEIPQAEIPQAEIAAGKEAGATWNRARETSTAQDTGVVRGEVKWLASAVANKANSIANRNRPNGSRPSAA